MTGQRVSDEELLTELRRLAVDKKAPLRKQLAPDSDLSNKYGNEVYRLHFGSWWKAVVQAGLIPHRRWPLQRTQYRQFHKAAIAHSNPKEAVFGLLALCTGMSLEFLAKVSPDWFEHLDDSRYQPVLTVPAEQTKSEDSWVLKIPNHIHFEKERVDTELPGLLRWYFNMAYPSGSSTTGIRNAIARIGSELQPLDRETTETSPIGEHPLIRPLDLRASAGIHLARRGAPKQRIRRHLGLKHLNSRMDVEDFYLWLYVHEDYKHPDYDPPDVVLDSVLSTDSL